MIAAHVTTHVTDGLARVMAQYKNSPQLTALVTALLGQVQKMEDAFFAMDDGRFLWNGTTNPAIGAQLDLIGKIAGIQRNGMDDPTYLIFIVATIAQNNSDGSIPTILAICQGLFNPTRVALNEGFPAEVRIEVYGPTVTTSLYALICTIVQASLGAGVELSMIVSADATNALMLDSVNGGIAPAPGTLAAVATPLVGSLLGSVIFHN